MLREVMEQLEKKFLIKPIRFKGIHRIEELEYPVAALREMLLNALVHRNYLGSMIQLKVYDNRLTLWNAGTLPLKLPIEKLHELHESIPRNPLIAEVCYKAGCIDSWGRGVEKITEACKAAKLPEPVFMERSGGFLVELARGKEGLRNQFGNKLGNELGNELGNTRTNILNRMKANPNISAAKIAEELKISSYAVEKQIKKLQETGFLKRVGGTRGHWEVTES